MALSLIKPPADYYPSFTQGRPIFNGSIYVGLPDTDPEILGNQIQLTVRQEDGTDVLVAQPVLTGSGGVPTYLGAPVQILAEGNYSIKVLNSAGTQVYYLENAFNGLPIVQGDPIEYAPPYTGSVPTTIEERLSRGVSVFDFMSGAEKTDAIAGTYTIDLSVAIQAAIDSLPLVYDGTGADPLTRNGTIYFPIASYLADTINIPAGVSFYAQNGSSVYGGGRTPVGSVIAVNNITGNGITLSGAQVKSSSQTFQNIAFVGGPANLAVTATAAVAGLLNCIYINEGFNLSFINCSWFNYNGGNAVDTASGTQMIKFINCSAQWIGDGGVNGGGLVEALAY